MGWITPPTVPMDEASLIGARMRALSTLSSPTAHELRGSASALALHLQLLSVEADDDAGRERQRRSLAIAQEERHRLFDLAETFVRNAALPDPQEVEFDLVAVTANAVNLVRPYAAQSRVELALRGDGGTLPVYGRRDVVGQVQVDLLLHLLARANRGSRVDVAVDAAAGAAVAAIRPVPGVAPDPEVVTLAGSTIRWAGGSVRLDADGFRLELPLMRARSLG
jgi:signal transduction histidine kinase